MVLNPDIAFGHLDIPPEFQAGVFPEVGRRPEVFVCIKADETMRERV
jgi:hypothetical protein